MTPRYLCLFSGAIGEATLFMHLGRVLSENVPGARLEMMSVRPNEFVSELSGELPFVAFRVMSKGRVSSWFKLLGLMTGSNFSIVYEPVTAPLPLWWRLILWCARFRQGSVQVWYQMFGHEHPVPPGVTALSYVCQEENLFLTPPRILEAWSIRPDRVPAPALPRTLSVEAEPYMLFHFFAGNYRRSIPTDHARAILASARIAFPTHAFIVSCAASERARAEQIIAGIKDVRIVAGLHATQMLSLLSGATVVIGTASGIIFLAAQLSVPTVSLSCLVDPCWLPTYAPSVITLAARDECRCNGDKTGECVEDTPDGEVFRCLYFISTEEVIGAMKESVASCL